MSDPSVPPPGGWDPTQQQPAPPPPPPPAPSGDWAPPPAGWAPPPDPTTTYGAPADYGAPPGAYGAPGGYPAPVPGYGVDDPRKSKMAGGLLGIFLGTFGVHNFYLGYTGKAIAQLLITVLSCGILSFIPMIWGLVEGIMILTGSIATDAAGVPLKD